MQNFIHTAGRSSVVLLIAAIVALIWANSLWKGSYFSLWHTGVSFDLGFISFSEDLQHWVNDGLMAIFFFVVGLEIKRELAHGELSSFRAAALPVVAALGGMIVPAIIYISLNQSGDGFRGWGIPMATDIAFALGVITVLGPRVPLQLKVFLLGLAIVDDIGAILVIAVFFTESISWLAFGISGIVLAVIIGMRQIGVQRIEVYLVMGILFWLAMLASGIHATLAGVVLGLLTPATAYYTADTFQASAEDLLRRFRTARQDKDSGASEDALGQLEVLTVGTEAPVERLERLGGFWASYVVLPVFALANAGVVLSAVDIAAVIRSPVTQGVMLGLLIGKPLGIIGFVWIGTRLRFLQMPQAFNWFQLAGVGILAGVGFAVSLFITGLAFDSPGHIEQAKIGILVASMIAGGTGYFLLRVGLKKRLSN